ncbi:BTB/POZ domain-containing protein 2-like isoform X1 [Chiloscyllium plagiosum]|uniref:BTB/POZ domain-containing protein 2-like isoform X1 n=2 Tax=Chiloscyllium plagiosum TaxID=36176 RepID=UPI001CB85F14|nr:BTB/POZ domain-containing protein 2-like isoform X1 [Chiloscyllium plagiosum]
MAAGGNNLSACNRVNIPNGGGGSGSPSLGTNSSSPSSLSGGVGPGGAGAGAGAGVGGGGGSAAAVVIYREPMYNWQATKTTVKERFAFLFNNEILSDVHFLVGKGMGTQRIPAHRFVLAVGSAVFDAMFNGGMATTSTEIELPDVEPAAFLALLKFLYSDEVQIGPETVMTTLYTAKKYAVPALEAHCVEFLKKNLRADNAFMLLTQVRWNIHVVHDICLQKELRRMRHRAMCGNTSVMSGEAVVGQPSGCQGSVSVWPRNREDQEKALNWDEEFKEGDQVGEGEARLFDEPQLASLCLENIDKNTSDAINAEGFTDIDLDTLMAVLERDTLGIREIRLFNAVVRWAEAECQRQQLQLTPENKRKVLGKALSLIRFPLMTIEEFAAGPAQSGILTDREVVSLFLHFTVNPKPRVEFIDRPRCCLRGKECSINRFQQVESRWGYSGTSDRIRFTVNRRIFVVGFGLYGSIHGPTDYQVNIQIIHTDSNTILGQNDTGFSCDGSSNTFRVMFKEPVEILPNVNYTACATLKGPDSHYGTKGLRKVIHESPTTGTKTVFTFCYAAGNNNGTSVEDGQVPEIIFYT